MGQVFFFSLLALIAVAALTLGLFALAVHFGTPRPDSQHSRETQFLAEQSLELTRQRAGRGTPPAGAALQSQRAAA